MNELPYLGFKFLWEFYLGSRQKRAYRVSTRHSLPDEVQRIFDDETFVRARAYSSDRIDCLTLKALYDAVLNAAFILFNIVQLFWNRSEALVGWAGIPASEALTTCVFVFLMNTFHTLAWLPIELHVHFRLEERHGFNRMSMGYFAVDKLKSYLLSQSATLLLTFAVVRIVSGGGAYCYLHLWVVLVLVVIFVNAVYPDFVAPVFDNISPLPDGELRNSIRTLTERVGYPLNRVYVLDASKRTGHSDAFHVGVFKSKRIVLFNTLLQGRRGQQWVGNNGLNNEEVRAVVGHELGHWSCNHILKLTTVSLLVMLLMLIAYGPSMKEKLIQKEFGSDDFKPVFVFSYYLLPARVGFLSLGLLWVGRGFESEADAFAGSLGLASDLRSALIKVHRDNLLFPVHDWLYSLSYDHHPPLLDRLRALDKYD